MDILLAGIKRPQLAVHWDMCGFFVERFQHHLFELRGLLIHKPIVSKREQGFLCWRGYCSNSLNGGLE